MNIEEMIVSIPVGSFPTAKILFFKLFESQDLEEMWSHSGSRMTLVVQWVWKHNRSHHEGGTCQCPHILSHISDLIFFI